jgi:acyl carrier protein
MYEFVEERLRHIVADRLGVCLGEIAPEVSLTDDLAADSLDLVDVALAVESDFGIGLPDRALQKVRTYADLLSVVLEVARECRRRDAQRAETPIVVRTRIVLAAEGGATFERMAQLTPYETEEIVEDALRAGRGTRLEVTLPRGTSDATLAGVQKDFERLGPRGITVRVGRDALSPVDIDAA